VTEIGPSFAHLLKRLQHLIGRRVLEHVAGSANLERG
jgi:hypothetical protein